MASLITLRRRIKSITSTRQITRAMQLVSVSKLRRAQAYANRSRDYQQLAYDLLAKLGAANSVAKEPLFIKRPIKHRLYVVITSNTGLAGAYNANVLKILGQSLREDSEAKIQSRVIAVGSKAAQFVRRIKNVELVAVYPPFGDQPTIDNMRPLLNTVISQYESEAADDIKLVYTFYISTINQEARISSLLPATPINADQSDESITAGVYTFEPDMRTVVEQITTRLIESQIWQAILESLASEHAMRMIATKNATDNANDLIDDYTLELNTARQAAITQELTEISAGVEALST